MAKNKRKNTSNNNLNESNIPGEAKQPASKEARINNTSTITAGSKIPENSSPVKEEALKWIFSILSALLVYFVVANVIQHYYHPDIAPLIAAADKLSFAGGARPEPVEALLFRAGLFVITGCIFLFYFLFQKSRWLQQQAAKPFFLIISAVCVIFIMLMIYYDFSAPNPFAQGGGDQPQNSRDLVAKTNFDFFFDGIFLGSHLFLYTFIIIPGIASFFYFGRKYNWDSKKLLQKGIWIAGYIIAGSLVLCVVLMNTFQFPYSFENKYDFNAVYYSMTQVFAGVPMLVDGFSNTYGLYPHFLNPLFQIIGLNVFKFSLIMSLLMGLAFTFNFYFLKKLISNNVILFLGFTSVIFFPYLDIKFLTPYDSSFATFPIRYIIPSTLIVLAYLYSKNRSKALYWTTCVTMGFLVLWNPEIGMVSYLSWLAFNLYYDFFSPDGKVNFRKLLFHVAVSILVIVAVILTFKGIFYLLYGVAPDLNLLFGYIVIFGKVGFGLLPMSLIHPWNINALTIILGLTLSITRIIKKDITQKSALIFLVSVIATGFLVYFQGRSHNWPFASSSGFCIILLIILGDELWTAIKDKDISPLHLLFVVFLFLISFSFFEIISNVSKLNELVYQDDDKEMQEKQEDLIKSNIDFINNRTKEKEKILVFSARQNEGLYFDGNKRRSAFNPGYEDMFLNDDLVKLANVIRDSSFQVFVDSNLAYYPFFVKPFAALSASYDVSESKNDMYLLHKRAVKLPATTFFGNANDDILHKKYHDDVSGRQARIEDAFGIKQVLFPPVFSIETLFYTSDQIDPFATIIGNMNDTSGLVIANIIKTPNYFFGINGKGSVVALPQHQWVYCVVNFYPDHLEIYDDGNLAATVPLPSPLRQSPEKLSIGNEGYFRYYTGAISEVAIHNRLMDKSQVIANWDEIRKL